MNNDQIPEPPDSDFRLSAQLTNENTKLGEEIAHLEKMRDGIGRTIEKKRAQMLANATLLAGRQAHLREVEAWKAQRQRSAKPALPAKEGGKPTWAV